MRVILLLRGLAVKPLSPSRFARALPALRSDLGSARRIVRSDHWNRSLSGHASNPFIAGPRGETALALSLCSRLASAPIRSRECAPDREERSLESELEWSCE